MKTLPPWSPSWRYVWLHGHSIREAAVCKGFGFSYLHDITRGITVHVE